MNRIQINKYSKFIKLIRVTVRIIQMYHQKPSFKNALLSPDRGLLEQAELLWVKEAQRQLLDQIKMGRFRRLCPQYREDGIVVVGGRAENRMMMTYNHMNPILLPYNHQFSHLYAEYIHSLSHLGVAATISKIRSKYWIVKIGKIVGSIRSRCITCKKRAKQMETQVRVLCLQKN